MKKYWKSIVFATLGIFALASCEDVPAPYTIPGASSGDDTDTTEVTEIYGEGTLESPYNVAGANKLCSTLDKSSTSATYLSDTVYVKGIISTISSVDTSYGNAVYYISDDGSTDSQLEVYRGKYLDGAKFTSADQISVGDTVIVCGQLQNWLGTYEFTSNSKLVYHNGTSGSVTPDTPVTPGTEVTGENLLVNGDFETWSSSTPDHWKSASSASNATLTQSTEEVHDGDFAVAVAGVASSNKRMAYEELTLKAGTYTFSIYAKASTSDASQCRLGYVPITDGTVGSYSYMDGYCSLNNTSWSQASYTFTLSAQTTVCLVVMNPKTSSYATAQTIYVDDATLVTSDGGIAE